jgi:hypothetical protein
VRNASNNAALDNATVCLEGYSQPSDYCDDTDDNGAYRIRALEKGGGYILPSGSQRFVAISDGFITVVDRAIIVYGQETLLNFALTPELISGDVRMRIVLTWDEASSWPPDNYPNDLDAHAWLNINNNVFYHVWYGNRETCPEPPYIYLENDVTHGSGPESIALCRLEGAGSYKYGVHNVYQGLNGVPLITQTDARVRVYDRENGLVLDENVPVTGSGNFWYVFSMNDQGVITVEDCIVNYNGEEPVCPP